MEPVLVTTGLSRRFGENWAVRKLTLTVERGQVFGFLGPNGAGKTTTVRLLNGILEASEGSVTVLGMNPNTHGADIRRHTGVLTESPSLYEALSARENLRFSGEVYGVPAEALPGRIDALLDRFGLLERANEKVGEYSRGMKQRLAVARALLHEPEIIFLDEPSAGLDPAAARDMLELVRDLSHRQGRTIFMCTHNLVEAERLCDIVGVIDRGRLRALGSPGELARQLWHNSLIEIDLRGVPDGPVQQAIRNVRGVQGLDQDGDLTLVQVSDPEVAPALVQAIVGAGGQIYGLHHRNHGLEDVYFALEHSDASETEAESSLDA